MCIFQLLTGANEDLLKRLNLSRDTHEYFFVKQGNAAHVHSISDKNDYRTVLSSLDTLNFSKSEQDTLWRVVAATLHLGNMEFDIGEEDKLFLKKSKSVEYAANLLQVKRNDLETALCERVIAVGGDIMRQDIAVTFVPRAYNTTNITFLFKRND